MSVLSGEAPDAVDAPSEKHCRIHLDTHLGIRLAAPPAAPVGDGHRPSQGAGQLHRHGRGAGTNQ